MQSIRYRCCMKNAGTLIFWEREQTSAAQLWLSGVYAHGRVHTCSHEVLRVVLSSSGLADLNRRRPYSLPWRRDHLVTNVTPKLEIGGQCRAGI